MPCADIGIHLRRLEEALEALRGQMVLVGLDSNAHSPLWFCEERHYVGRGYEVAHKRQMMEDAMCADPPKKKALLLVNKTMYFTPFITFIFDF